MFGIDDILLASLIGGGLGIAKTGKIKDGLLGAGLGAGGAAILGPASVGAASEGMGGLLSNPIGNAEAASLYGTNLGSQQTAMLAAQDAGLSSSPAMSLLKEAKPFTDAAGTGMQVAKAMTPQEAPYTPVTSQMPQRQPQEFPFSQMPLQAITDDNERRKKMMQMFAQNAMGR